MPMRSPLLWSEALINSDTSSSDSSYSPPELVPRNMHDSYCEQLLSFASNPQLLEQYTNASGGIQTGKLMEHLDSLAGSIAYKYMLGPGVETVGSVQEQGFYIVTASVDRLDMLAPLSPVRDMRLSGQVIYTGKSSMEVAVQMEALGKDGQGDETLLLGRFSMVCRDAYTHKAHGVHPLVVSTPEERALHAMGEAHKTRRQSMASRSLDRVPPSSAEAQVLHDFYLKYGRDDQQLEEREERVWMGDTKLEKCMLMFPQERNVHQKVFGGYLMRLAYELAFTNARLFTRDHVRFLSLDGISFARPVPIGCVLRLTSHIVHSTTSRQFPALVHALVQANVVDVKTGQERTTNNFRFTWCREEGEPLRRQVVPKTYQEAMHWLDAKRALEMGAEIRGLRSTKLIHCGLE
ncbi:Thioesterase/thiol ester dehydrase-isomerase [Neolentinus lepideus HHB14362 ss-1]|uniref:Thioesterase/thiol ester dehydrase-isomerase n=1 Tax=Neolentinus lepideus HHB14362 ss-1 TaxID=1314782 RepID=A0A165SBN6_9AGAM|nr:Thioesterase/thiol ester dehydrase-isomerase [Neolentinus lepideus HHB14362 ss-1]